MDDQPGETIPIFPLANVVLYPMLSVPLYIFEPRYRQMTQAALDGSRRIGMVVVKPQHEANMGGDPPVFSIGCEGSISHAEERPDGTWNILLTATRRFRLIDEPARPEDQLYRAAIVEGLEEPNPEPQRLARLRGEIGDRLLDVLSRVATGEEEPPSLERLDEFDDQRFVNVLSQAIDLNVLEKQQLLEANGVLDRAQTLRDLLQFRLVEMGAGAATGRERLQ